MSNPDVLTRRAEREKQARIQAEQLLEEKSLELYQLNKELKESAETLTKSEARIRSIVKHAFEGIIVTNKDGEIESFNTAVFKIFDYPNEMQLNGKKITLLIPSHQLSNNPNFEITESQGNKYDNTLFPIEYSVSHVPDGDSWDMTWIIRDISRRKQSEMELKEVHQKLLDTSRLAGMAEIASSVLHNIGNVLNSVTTSATIIGDQLENSKLGKLDNVLSLLKKHENDLSSYFTENKEGQKLIQYLELLIKQLKTDNSKLIQENKCLEKGIDHIKKVVSAQQSYTGQGGVLQAISVVQLLEDALAMNATTIEAHQIDVAWELDSSQDEIYTDKHKIIQIIDNLIRNAVDSIATAEKDKPLLILKTKVDETIQSISIIDNGIGIAPENLIEIFRYGFTSKPDGHGLGLHSSILTAKELGGELTVTSKGEGKGAIFQFSLPVTVKNS